MQSPLSFVLKMFCKVVRDCGAVLLMWFCVCLWVRDFYFLPLPVRYEKLNVTGSSNFTLCLWLYLKKAISSVSAANISLPLSHYSVIGSKVRV